MQITDNETRNKQIWRSVIVAVVVQLVALIVFFTKLDARVLSLEKTVSSDLYYTSAQGILLEQRVDFYVGSVIKIENKLEQILERLPARQ